MKEVSPQELKAMKEGNEAFQLIDVREAYEAEICSIGGTLIPMGEIIARLNEVRKDVPVVIHCRSGSRSSAVIQALSDRYGYTNLINLKGGILGYGSQVDETLRCE
ncbi:MAG: rhodanese-like domain-containing protein [Flavobacteriales bacterium]|nr:rhodanese-like domain-containing protein [Flavobacteriales bacterium]